MMIIWDLYRHVLFNCKISLIILLKQFLWQEKVKLFKHFCVVGQDLCKIRSNVKGWVSLRAQF